MIAPHQCADVCVYSRTDHCWRRYGEHRHAARHICLGDPDTQSGWLPVRLVPVDRSHLHGQQAGPGDSRRHPDLQRRHPHHRLRPAARAQPPALRRPTLGGSARRERLRKATAQGLGDGGG